MFIRFAPNASLVASAMITGLRLRSCALTHIVTVLSVIPFAIFASVFPVQGATMSASYPPRVIFSSASRIDSIGFSLQIPVTVSLSVSALPNRVSVSRDASDNIGVTLFTAAIVFNTSIDLAWVQNEPQSDDSAVFVCRKSLHKRLCCGILNPRQIQWQCLTFLQR